eukprot:m.259146 g.259146  ORF g.259146 m.259146 type:complete len:241 (+) comp15549_c4_seq2:234-956(+)
MAADAGSTSYSNTDVALCFVVASVIAQVIRYSRRQGSSTDHPHNAVEHQQNAVGMFGGPNDPFDDFHVHQQVEEDDWDIKTSGSHQDGTQIFSATQTDPDSRCEYTTLLKIADASPRRFILFFQRVVLEEFATAIHELELSGVQVANQPYVFDAQYLVTTEPETLPNHIATLTASPVRVSCVVPPNTDSNIPAAIRDPQPALSHAQLLQVNVHVSDACLTSQPSMAELNHFPMLLQRRQS